MTLICMSLSSPITCGRKFNNNIVHIYENLFLSVLHFFRRPDAMAFTAFKVSAQVGLISDSGRRKPK